MLTIFTTAKPFHGHTGVIQRNALKSWTLLQPSPQVILFGNEEGSAEVAAELNLAHIADVERSEFGTPLISSMFHQAERLSSNPLLCYVNADIMLTSRFITALRVICEALPRFVVTGQRTPLEVNGPWDFDRADWEGELHRHAAGAKLDIPQAMDYFAFPRGAFPDIPPFLVGRVRWDNWMIYSARRRGIPVVNATLDLPIFHQNHDYSHLAGGLRDCYTSPEGQRNQDLYGVPVHVCVVDSTYELRNGRLRRALGGVYLRRHLYTFSVFHPHLAPLGWMVGAALSVYHSLRRRVMS